MHLFKKSLVGFILYAVAIIALVHTVVMFVGHRLNLDVDMSIWVILLESLILAFMILPIIHLLTKRKIERETVESERRFQRLFEKAPVPYLSLDSKGTVIEAMAGQPLATRVLGQDPVPGIPQNAHLEEKLVVSPEKVIAAARQVMALPLGSGAAATAPAPAATPAVLWTPNRNFVA